MKKTANQLSRYCLHIVKHAAQYHGSKMTLESEVGAGTTVTIIF